MQKSDWLIQIKHFMAVVDAMSFTHAAAKLYSSPAAVSRQVRWLEERLKVTLIQRTTRQLQITDEGKYLYEKGKRLFAELDEIVEHFHHHRTHLKGPLKITMPTAFGETRMMQLIEKFARQHPDIEYILDFSNASRDLIADEIDVAIRRSPYHGEGYDSFKLATVQVGIYAAPQYLKHHGEPKKIQDLVNHNCLLHQQFTSGEWDFKNQQIVVDGNIKANNSFTLIQFAKAGLGIIRTLNQYLVDDIKQKKLVPILQSQWPKPLQFYLVHRAGVFTPKRITTFVDYMKTTDIAAYLE